MSCEMKDVVMIAKKLDKMISTKTLNDVIGLELLKTLKSLPMTLDVLQTTRIGMTVNGYRKLTKNEEAISLAKALIKIWKKLLQDSNEANASSANVKSQSSLTAPSMSRTNSGGRGFDDTDSRDSSSQSDVMVRTDSPKIGDLPKTGAQTERAPSVSGQRMRSNPTNDSVRLKCREMLADVLQSDKHTGGYGHTDSVAAAIEEAIFAEFKLTNPKYKNRIRSRIINLKDVRNPRLKERVLSGLISPEHMAVMTPEEMASEELQDLRRKMTKEAIDEHSMASMQGIPSDLFLCENCNSRDTVYNQVETSTDMETTTTFVLCNDCGNRWKVA